MSIAALYKQALEIALIVQAKVFNYADEDDFATLWATPDDPTGPPAVLSSWSDDAQALVIVWDGQPPTSAPGGSEGLLLKHLTPLDWAVAFSSRVLAADDLRIRARFEIVIIDLTCERDTDAWSSRMRNQILADLPWVSLCSPLPAMNDAGARSWHQIYRPVVEPSAASNLKSAAASQQEVNPHRSPLLVKDETGHWQICVNSANEVSSRDLDQTAFTRMKAMSSQWLASLAHSDDHHDINNVVGARVLMSALGVQIGVVADQLFAAVVLTQADGTKVPLGEDRSKAVIAHLREVGYIDGKGRMEHPLAKAMNDNALALPPEFDSARNEIAALLQTVSTRSYIAEAFLTRLVWCNQLPVVGKHHLMQVRDSASSLAAAGAGNIEILLVDDMLNDGWGEVVASLLGLPADSRCGEPFGDSLPAGLANLGSTCDGQASLSLFGSDSASILVDYLSSASFHTRDFSSRILPTTAGHGNVEVLLLDLRLYAERSRTAFHKLTTTLWRKIRPEVTTGESQLAWPSLASDAPAIDRWTNGDPSADVPLEVLALIPRALALAYPMLPIVLFSSTGRADIKEKLKAYRNIFTGFEKPRVLASPESIERSITALADGLKGARNLVRAAAACQQLVNYTRSFKIRQPKWRSKKPIQYVEIFLDERGGEDPGVNWRGCDLRSVATVLMFESEDSANQFQRSIEAKVDRARNDNSLLSPSWVHWESRPRNRLEKVDKVEAETKKERNDEIVRRLRAGVKVLRPIFEEHRVSCFSVGIEQLELPLGPTRRDAIYDRMIRLNVEFIANALIPLFGVSRFEWRLYLPQRQVGVKDEAHARELTRLWGLDYVDYFDKRTGKTEWVAKTYPAGSYYPFIRELTHRWQGGCSELLSGRGIALNYFEDWTCASRDEVNALWPRWIAGLSDWVANASQFRDRLDALDPIVNNLGLTKSATGHSPDALELGIEAIRQATLPNGSTTQMVEHFLASWERFLMPSGCVPSGRESGVALAIYTLLLRRLKSASGRDLISAATKHEVPAVRGIPAQFSGSAYVEEVHPRDVDEKFGQYVVVTLGDAKETRVVLGTPCGEPDLSHGAVLEVQLRQPDGTVALDDDTRANFYSVLSSAPRQLTRGAEEGVESPERTEELASATNAISVVAAGPDQRQSADIAIHMTGKGTKDAESLEPIEDLASTKNAMAAIAAAADQRQLASIATESSLELTIVRLAGPYAVLEDANGVQYAIHRQRDELKPGKVLRCRPKGNRAEVDVGRPMLPFAVVV